VRLATTFLVIMALACLGPEQAHKIIGLFLDYEAMRLDLIRHYAIYML
jgi:hypothetical protein